MNVTNTHCRLLAAVLDAVEHHSAPNRFALSKLESLHRGPAAGAAGCDVKKWPKEGIEHQGYRLTIGKIGRATCVEVSERRLWQSARVGWQDIKDEVARLLQSGFPYEAIPPALTDLAERGPDYVRTREICEVPYTYHETIHPLIGMSRAFMTATWDR